MTTIKRIGKAKIILYVNDHLPPHVHVRSPEGEVVVFLDEAEVVGSPRAVREAAEALAWIESNRPALLQLWKEVNG